MIEASLVDVARDGKESGQGAWEFLQLPAPGDRITIPAANGDVKILTVIYVEHRPQRTDSPAKADLASPPTATIFVEHRSNWSPNL